MKSLLWPATVCNCGKERVREREREFDVGAVISGRGDHGERIVPLQSSRERERGRARPIAANWGVSIRRLYLHGTCVPDGATLISLRLYGPIDLRHYAYGKHHFQQSTNLLFETMLKGIAFLFSFLLLGSSFESKEMFRKGGLILKLFFSIFIFNGGRNFFVRRHTMTIRIIIIFLFLELLSLAEIFFSPRSNHLQKDIFHLDNFLLFPPRHFELWKFVEECY